MSGSGATRPASRMKDCEGKRRTVDPGEKASGMEILRKQAVGPAARRQGTTAQSNFLL